MTNTKTMINNLINPATSAFDKGESLNTLIKHNLFTHLKEELKECYFNEDYQGAYELLKDIEITTVKPKYTQYKPKSRRGDSRATIGLHMVTQGNNNGWSEGINIMERLDLLATLKRDPSFIARAKALREISKRKSRLSKAKATKRTSKSGKATKYTKRERVVPPSKR